MARLVGFARGFNGWLVGGFADGLGWLVVRLVGWWLGFSFFGFPLQKAQRLTSFGKSNHRSRGFSLFVVDGLVTTWRQSYSSGSLGKKCFRKKSKKSRKRFVWRSQL